MTVYIRFNNKHLDTAYGLNIFQNYYKRKINRVIKSIFIPFKEVADFISDIFEKRYLIYELVKRDFTSRYTGTTLGIFWSFLQPLIMTLIMWFVFTYGFKAGAGSNEIPFVAYLFTGMLAWSYFSETFTTSTTVITEYSFLVKKVNFRVSILPVVKLISGLVVHLLFMIIVITALISNGIKPSLIWLQSIYYLICMMILTLGLSWITSSINVFIRDIRYIITILVQFGFWITPIFWDSSILPQKWHIIIKLNPMAYIINGYRDCFIYNQSLWENDILATIYFWCFAIIVLISGILIFKSLRPHFADVL